MIKINDLLLFSDFMIIKMRRQAQIWTHISFQLNAEFFDFH